MVGFKSKYFKELQKSNTLLGKMKIQTKFGKLKYVFTLGALSAAFVTGITSSAFAQTVDGYDEKLAPYIRGNNPPPGAGSNKRSIVRPTDFLPPTPLRVFTRILSTPNKAGSWRETYPGDPADVDGDGLKDMSYPYYPKHWRDSNGDGFFDQSYDSSY